LEALPHARLGLCFRAQYLDGDRALEALVEAVEHPRHTAFSEERMEAVPTTNHPYDRARLHPCCLPLGYVAYSYARPVAAARV
jgi:hypothetical protein